MTSSTAADVEPGGLRNALRPRRRSRAAGRTAFIASALRPGRTRQASAGHRSKSSPPALDLDARRGSVRRASRRAGSCRRAAGHSPGRAGPGRRWRHAAFGDRRARVRRAIVVARDAGAGSADVGLDQQRPRHPLGRRGQIGDAVDDARCGHGVTESGDQRHLARLGRVDRQRVGAVEHARAVAAPVVEQGVA